MSEFKAGDIVRYSSGSTALVKLNSTHCGGWHGLHCMGGGTYVTPPLQLADEEDLRMWNKQAWHRGEGIPPDFRPLIRKVGGFYRVVVKAHIPNRWMKMHLAYADSAHAFVRRINQENAHG